MDGFIGLYLGIAASFLIMWTAIVDGTYLRSLWGTVIVLCAMLLWPVTVAYVVVVAVRSQIVRGRNERSEG